MSNHSSKALHESRSADDTGQRREAPAGVGPMIDMLHGKTRDYFFAGIVDDGGVVSSSGFQKQPRVVSPVSKGEKGRFQTFEHEYIL